MPYLLQIMPFFLVAMLLGSLLQAFRFGEETCEEETCGK